MRRFSNKVLLALIVCFSVLFIFWSNYSLVHPTFLFSSRYTFPFVFDDDFPYFIYIYIYLHGSGTYGKFSCRVLKGVFLFLISPPTEAKERTEVAQTIEIYLLQ